MTVPPLTWLYVPADRPDRVEKAIASSAHAVIVDGIHVPKAARPPHSWSATASGRDPAG